MGLIVKDVGTVANVTNQWGDITNSYYLLDIQNGAGRISELNVYTNPPYLALALISEKKDVYEPNETITVHFDFEDRDVQQVLDERLEITFTYRNEEGLLLWQKMFRGQSLLTNAVPAPGYLIK